MVVLDEGLNKIATDLGSSITLGQWGSGTALPLVTDTGLNTPIAATLDNVTSAVSANSVQYTHSLNAGTANPGTFAEFELQFSNGDSLNHSVGAEFAKTTSFIVTTITTVNLVRNN